ncbi:MAG: hypothetical protein ACK5L5_04150 [Bacteroidales bacterium]
MSSAVEAIKQAMEKSQRSTRITQTKLGKIESVAGFTCEVSFEDAPTLHDVRLLAIEDEISNYTIVYPQVGSLVLVGIIEDNRTDAAIIKCSEIDCTVVTIGETSWTIDKDGCSLQGKGESLVDVLSDIITEIKKIIVVQGTSPDLPALTEIDGRLKKILK